MIELDRNADTFPAGLLGTPFEAVYRALRIVAATVWDVDPLVYRAGMAWGWYALHDPAALAGFRDVVTAALISAVAPMVKDTQTDAELVEYLRQWRSYTPTFPKLQALYALFGAVVDVQPISDPESQTVLPVDDTRLAFYLRIESIDFSRPLSLSEAREIAVRATPLGSRPYPYYALETRIPCAVLPAPVGIYVRVQNWELARPPAPPQQLGELVFVDASTGDVVYSVESLNEMAFVDAGYFTIDGADDVVFVEQSQFPIVCTYTESIASQSVAPDAGFATGLPYYGSKLYSVQTSDGVNVTRSGWEAGEEPDMPNLYATNKTSSTITVTSCTVHFIDSTDASLVTVYDSNDAPCDAFQYSLSGVPWWYVLDGVHDAWVDDLSSIGYHLPTVLPTVTLASAYVYSASDPSTMTIWAGNSFMAKDASGNSISYDASLLYKAYASYADADSSIWFNDGWVPIESSGLLAIKLNVPSGSRTVHHVCYATCSDSTAIVVTVYDSSNNAFNAFKYTANNTDYYYVLDGTQTDWTDDLSSIGYRVEDYIDIFAFGQTGTVSRQGSVTSSFSGTVDSSCVIKLYDGPNLVTPMPFDSTVRYDVGYYDNGNWVPDAVQSLADMPATTSSPYVTAGLAIDSSGQLSIWEVRNQTGAGSANITWNNWQIRAYSAAYTTWNLPRQTAYFTNSGSAGTTNTKVTPSQGGNGYQLYDASGNPIPYDSSKTYKFLRGFDVSGGGVPFAGRLYFNGGGGYLRLYSYGWNWSTDVFRIEYSVT